MSVMEIMWGLIHDIGTTKTLLRQAPMDGPKDLVLTGRIVAAREAHELNRVTCVVTKPDRQMTSCPEQLCKDWLAKWLVIGDIE